VATNTYSHQFLRFTYTDFSLEQITGLASTTLSITTTALSTGPFLLHPISRLAGFREATVVIVKRKNSSGSGSDRIRIARARLEGIDDGSRDLVAPG
jgi:hypothetical protein